MWNTLPSYIRDTTKSIESFKTLLRKHYKDLTDSVFNPMTRELLSQFV